MRCALVLLLATAINSYLVAGPVFKKDAVLKAYVGEELKVDLRTLLSDEGTGILAWDFDSDKPTWLSIEKKSNIAFGKPTITDLGVSRFQLKVSDSTSRASFVLPVKIVAKPRWADDRLLDLGEHLETLPFNKNIKDRVILPGGGDVVFSSQNLPAWLTLNASGGLSGQPTRTNIGAVTNAKIIATGVKDGESTPIELKLTITKVNQPPKWLEVKDLSLSVDEGKNLDFDLRPKVKNTEKAELTFVLLDSSPWLKIKSTGQLYGQPDRGAVGTKIFRVQVSGKLDDNLTYSDVAKIPVTVRSLARAPQWKTAVITLPETIAGVMYEQNLLASLNNPDGVAVTFAISPLNTWAKVDEKTGKLGGKVVIPASGAGVQSWTVSLTDAEGRVDSTKVQIKVQLPPAAPHWKKSEITHGVSAHQDQLFPKTDLKKYIEGDAGLLRFEKISGPPEGDWGDVTDDGIFSGVPSKANVPASRFKFQVSNAVGKEILSLTINVLKVNLLPEWNESPVRLTIGQGQKLDLDLTKTASDPDGDKLTFKIEKVIGPGWAKISEDLTRLVGKAPAAGTEQTQYVIRAFDGQGGQTDCLFSISLGTINQPPQWDTKGLVLKNLTTKQNFSVDLTEIASDPDLKNGDRLSFFRTAGPSWLVVDRQGTLHGTAPSNLGLVNFDIEVSDRLGLSAVGNFRITIVEEPAKIPEPTVKLEPPVIPLPPSPSPTPTAPVVVMPVAEPEPKIIEIKSNDCLGGSSTHVVWLLDHTAFGEQLVEDVRNASESFYKILDNSGVTSTSAVATTSGTLVGKKNALFSGREFRENQTSFLERAKWIIQGANSPLWSLSQILGEKNTEWLGDSFFREFESAEIIFVTGSRDQHSFFSSRALNQVFPAEQYRDFYRSTFRKAKMPLRIHALVKACTKLSFSPGTESYLADEQTYLRQTQATGGLYLNNCDGRTAENLAKLAQVFSERACLVSHRFISSERAPKAITVNGKILDPKSWSYDPVRKQTEIFWLAVGLERL